jgi:hypothetical protein
MTVDRRLLYVGVFFIATGAILLVAQSGVVDGEDIAAALRYWPFLVIALGIGLLMRLTRFAVAGGVLAAAVAGLFLGGMIASAPDAVAHTGLECNDVRPASLASQQGTFAGSASVDLRLACGEVTVTTGTGDDWRLEAGNGTGNEAAVEASADRLSIASDVAERPRGFVRGSDVWRLTIPDASTIDLQASIDAGRGRFDLVRARLGDVRLDVNAGEARIDLTGATLNGLSVQVNGGAAWVTLPATQDLEAELVVNAGALQICTPSDLGLRISHEGMLTVTTYAGLVRSGGTWQSPGYAAATHHADVTVTANVGSVDVNPEGGCK